MSNIQELTSKLKALSHPIRLKAIILLAKEGEPMYLNAIAKRLNINRALAKIHLKKLRDAGIVKSTVVLVKGAARALRYYQLQDFDIHMSPETLTREMANNEK